jgi:hypothetical protein
MTRRKKKTMMILMTTRRMVLKQAQQRARVVHPQCSEVHQQEALLSALGH